QRGKKRRDHQLARAPLRLSLPMNFTHLLVRRASIGDPEEAPASAGLRAGSALPGRRPSKGANETARCFTSGITCSVWSVRGGPLSLTGSRIRRAVRHERFNKMKVELNII